MIIATAAVRREIRNGGLDAIERRLRAAKSAPNAVAVGLPRGSDPEQLMKLTYSEFGTSRQPERPAFRNAMRDGRARYMRLLGRSLEGLLLGTTSLPTALNRLGILATGDVQQSITDLRDPPNAPSTIAAKGSSNPLVDTGAMRQAITHEVRRHSWGGGS
ncbi:hypothetical protein ACTZWW_03135 [Salinarimonas sp. NSM]|uniref:hypothetical protein n=1 Tax=Salinarimonas sp. NSM TaxID=3458003 RepID=UPI0040355CA8